MIDQEEALAVRQRLDTLTEQINQRLDQWQTKFQAYGFGVRCTYRPKDSSVTIAYEKYGGKWVITVESEGEKWDVRSAPRTLRLYAAKRMEEFEEHMLVASKKVIGRMERYLMGDEDGQTIDEGTD